MSDKIDALSRSDNQALQQCIVDLKTSPDDTYFMLTDEDQEKVCALYANTMTDLDDLLCDINPRQAIAWWKATDDAELGRYVRSVMKKYIEPLASVHFDGTYVDDDRWIDEVGDRMRDRELA